jgi:endonuclease/exonuclease/phosphatase family metal-dependent hydrolase
MTFNIRHGLGADRRVDLSRTARVIAAVRPDVVALQEVDRHLDARSGFVDQAGWLARTLTMHLAFGAAVDRDPPAPGRPRRQFGNAILSVAPILEWDHTPLPRPGGEQRGLLRAQIAARGASWQVYATHLDHADAERRRAQASAIAQLLGAPERAVVLCGDLNATPASAEVRILTDGLRDAWPAVRTGRGLTHPSPIPLRRIDYVLCAERDSVRAAHVFGSVWARLASDHLPVVAEIEAPGV